MDIQVREEHLSGNKMLDLQHINIFIQAMKIQMMAKCMILKTPPLDFVPLQEELTKFGELLNAHSEYEKYLMESMGLACLTLREQERAPRIAVRASRNLSKHLAASTLNEVLLLIDSVYVHMNDPHEIALILAVKKARKLQR